MTTQQVKARHTLRSLHSIRLIRTDRYNAPVVPVHPFIAQHTSDYALIMAASVVALIPVLVLFLSLQKQFVQGVVALDPAGKRIIRYSRYGYLNFAHVLSLLSNPQLHQYTSI